MQTLECPLQKKASETPNKLFIQGDETYSYLKFHHYCIQIAQNLKSFPKGSVIASKIENPIFAVALLLACIRTEKIFFPLSFRLPETEIQKRLEETKAAYYFEKPLNYNPNLTLSEKKYTWKLKSPITYLLTSGSTSKPKVCVHSLSNHYYSALGSNETLPYSSLDSWLLSLPLFHVGGLSIVFRTLLVGATLTITNKPLDESLLSFPITHISLVNSQLVKLLEKPHLLSKLKVLLLGGGPIYPDLLQEAISLNLPIYTTYGLTEMASQVATAKNNLPLKILPYREASITPKGEILVKGQTLFMGYLKKGAIDPSVNPEGWFETKDLGKIENRTLHIQGRIDNQFISGGENIQPEEIEFYLLQHPEVLEALIVPKNDPLFGKVPIAFIKTKKELSKSSLISFLEKHLPRFKIPKIYLPLHYEGLKPSRKIITLGIKKD